MNTELVHSKLKDFCSELLDDMATTSIDQQVFTSMDAAEMFVGELDTWLSYYQERADFFNSLKNELRKRIS